MTQSVSCESGMGIGQSEKRQLQRPCARCINYERNFRIEREIRCKEMERQHKLHRHMLFEYAMLLNPK